MEQNGYRVTRHELWKWAEDNYPGAEQILDYFHAVEKLGKFASLHFTKDEEKRKKWLDQQKALLLENGVFQVVQKVKSIKSRSEESKNAKQTLIRYYEEHEDRMQYKTYLDKGLTIGSGAIEAAHKNVLQQRLKLSGQRWSIKGAQHIANLRCNEKSNNWKAIRYLIQMAA
ncbi:MAG: hypothetical protein ACE5RE_07890 [Candidatus Nitrosomaritimum aestuariumsis]